MTSVHSTHQFAEAAGSQIQGLSSHHCELVIRQGPENARVAIGKEKDRKPIDPPPIIQLKISSQADSSQNFLQSPYFFMSCCLLPETEHAQLPKCTGSLGSTLAGTLVSSLHRLKDTEHVDGAFFVFGDLSVKHEGKFRLQFTLYEMRQKDCAYITSTTSLSFPVHSTKNFQGMSESTALTRSFSDQGVRLRLRKEPRTLLRKRGPAHDDYEPRHYRQSNRQSSTGGERQIKAPPESHDAPRREESEQTGYNERQAWGRPTATRHYSQHSNVSFSDATGHSYDDYQTSKRPRTGSNPSQPSSAFGGQVHPNTLENTSFASRPYPESQPNYNQYAPAQPSSYSTYAFTQSPQSATSYRQSFFPDRIGSQAGSTGTSSPFDPNLARSPQDAHFPLQSHSTRYNQQMPFGNPQSLPMATMAPMVSSMQQISTGPISTAYPASNYEMLPPVVRMGGNLGYPSFPASSTSNRRDPYTFSAPGTNPNMSAGNIGSPYSQG